MQRKVEQSLNSNDLTVTIALKINDFFLLIASLSFPTPFNFSMLNA